ncbi:MAG TPA: hypothetical protein VH593_30520 [Ktedonobacteraceae bacterium]
MMTVPGGCEVRCPTMNDSAVVLALIQEKERAEYGPELRKLSRRTGSDYER